jgi:hypothetical protein
VAIAERNDAVALSVLASDAMSTLLTDVGDVMACRSAEEWPEPVRSRPSVRLPPSACYDDRHCVSETVATTPAAAACSRPKKCTAMVARSRELGACSGAVTNAAHTSAVEAAGSTPWRRDGLPDPHDSDATRRSHSYCDNKTTVRSTHTQDRTMAGRKPAQKAASLKTDAVPK